ASKGAFWPVTDQLFLNSHKLSKLRILCSLDRHNLCSREFAKSLKDASVVKSVQEDVADALSLGLGDRSGVFLQTKMSNARWTYPSFMPSLDILPQLLEKWEAKPRYP
ncbi:MAG: hypothetical protein AAGI38_17845, partial [Bacteroidota bacterium]